jgi:hypothetical protein
VTAVPFLVRLTDEIPLLFNLEARVLQIANEIHQKVLKIPAKDFFSPTIQTGQFL